MKPFSPLPPHWEACFDEDSQRWYYIDHKNRTTSWTLPMIDTHMLTTDRSGSNIETELSDESESIVSNEQLLSAMVGRLDSLSDNSDTGILDKKLSSTRRIESSIDSADYAGQRSNVCSRRGSSGKAINGRDADKVIEYMKSRRSSTGQSRSSTKQRLSSVSESTSGMPDSHVNQSHSPKTKSNNRKPSKSASANRSAPINAETVAMVPASTAIPASVAEKADSKLPVRKGMVDRVKPRGPDPTLRCERVNAKGPDKNLPRGHDPTLVRGPMNKLTICGST